MVNEIVHVNIPLIAEFDADSQVILTGLWTVQPDHYHQDRQTVEWIYQADSPRPRSDLEEIENPRAAIAEQPGTSEQYAGIR